MSVFQGHIQQKLISGSFPPGPPPSPVQIGRMLIVSSLGVDLTGTRQDVVFHYETVEAALIDCQAGDVIIVYPGEYSVSDADGLSKQDRLTIFMCPGAKITGPQLFNTLKSEFKIVGFGDIVSTGANDFDADSDHGVPVIIQCNSLSLVNTQITTGVKLNIFCYDQLTFANNSYGYCLLVNSDLMTGWITQINITSPVINLLSATTTNGMVFQDLYPDSHIQINANIVAGSYHISNMVYVDTRSNTYMDWICTVNGNITNYHTNPSPTSYDQIVVADENAFIAPGDPNYGFVINGNITAKDKLAIRMAGGFLIVNGNIYSEYIEDAGGAVYVTAGSITLQPSLLILNDGKGVSVNGPLIWYIDANSNMVQLKNYTGISGGSYLIDCGAASQYYQCLSCYSNKPVNNTNITNMIAATTLIVDAAIL